MRKINPRAVWILPDTRKSEIEIKKIWGLGGNKDRNILKIAGKIQKKLKQSVKKRNKYRTLKRYQKSTFIEQEPSEEKRARYKGSDKEKKHNKWTIKTCKIIDNKSFTYWKALKWSPWLIIAAVNSHQSQSHWR